MKKKLLSNWGLKLASILLAFVLWIIVVNIDNPVEYKEFRNVKVQLMNEDLLEEQNQVYKVLDSSDYVRKITVYAPKKMIGQITEDDIVAVADFANKTLSDTIEVKCSVPKYSDQVTEIKVEGNQLKLEVEDKKTKYVELLVETTGEVREGYEVESKKPELSRITISGAESAVNKVKYAAVTVSIEDIAEDVTTPETIRLYDEEGNEVVDSSIRKNASSSRVYISVLATKTVPLSFSVSGKPADGYMATGVIESDTETVKIAGTPSVLNGISSIVIPEDQLNITGQTDNMQNVIDIKPYLPEGTQLAQGNFKGKVSVTVYIEPIMQKKLNIPVSNIQLLNVPEGLDWEFTDDSPTYEMAVRGLNAEVSLLHENVLRGTVDLAAWMEEQEIQELNPGTYRLPVTFDLSEGLEITQPITVKVTFVRQEEENDASSNR